MELITTFLANLPWALLAGIAAGFFRNIAGWIENAYMDGKVESFEWKQLFGTIVKYCFFIIILSLGLDPGEAIIGAFIADVGPSALKKIGTNTVTVKK